MNDSAVDVAQSGRAPICGIGDAGSNPVVHIDRDKSAMHLSMTGISYVRSSRLAPVKARVYRIKSDPDGVLWADN